MTQRKTSKNHTQILTGTPTKQPSMSPSRVRSGRSPLSTSKYMAQSSFKQTVSYGQLQIVLQNIQQIRRKAASQIKALNGQNDQLKEQLNVKQQTIEEMKMQIEGFSSTKTEIQEKLYWKIQTLQKQLSSIQTLVHDKQRRIIQLQVRNKELEKETERQIQCNDLKSKEIQELKKKWKWAFEILAGDQERAEELVWQVKRDYEAGIWDVIGLQGQLQVQLNNKTRQNKVLQNQLEESKDQIRQNSLLLDKCLNQIKDLSSKNNQIEEEIRGHREKNNNLQREIASQSQDKQQLLSKSQKQRQTLKQLIEEEQSKFKRQIQDKNSKISILEREIQQKQMKERMKQQKQIYEQIISQACQCSQQYTQLIERVRYLQKFRSQHYFNIEKIQFLCKMLDH